MNILLVYINNPELNSDLHAALMPVGLPLMVALLRREGHDARVANLSGVSDDEVERILYEFKPRLVGISQLTHNRHQSVELASIVKRCVPDSYVVFGGPHATFSYEELLREQKSVDLVVLGEGDQTILELVSAMEAPTVQFDHVAGLAMRKGGQVVKTATRRAVTAFDAYPLAHEGLVDAFHVNPRHQAEFIITSRGCPARCTFCSSPEYWNSGLRFRSIPSMIDEVRALRDTYGLLYLSIRDDTFTTDRKRVMGFCKELIEQKLFFVWNCQSRVQTVDPEILLWMKRAGCECIQFGVESGSQMILDSLGKRNDLESVVAACQAVRAVGMNLALYLISGVPDEQEQDIDDTLTLLRRIRPHDIQVSPLAYYPGTAIYSQAVATGKVSAQLFSESSEPGLYVCRSKAYRSRHDRLLAEGSRLAAKNAYTSNDYKGHRRIVGFSYSGNLMEGEYWENAGNLKRAEDLYREVCSRQPENPWGWLALTGLTGSCGRFSEAEEALSRVLQLVPKHAPAYTMMGEIALCQGDTGRARSFFNKALECDPDDATASALLVKC